jgi:hypothetical protein
MDLGDEEPGTELVGETASQMHVPREESGDPCLVRIDLEDDYWDLRSSMLDSLPEWGGLDCSMPRDRRCNSDCGDDMIDVVEVGILVVASACDGKDLPRSCHPHQSCCRNLLRRRDGSLNWECGDSHLEAPNNTSVALVGQRMRDLARGTPPAGDDGPHR